MATVTNSTHRMVHGRLCSDEEGLGKLYKVPMDYFV